MGLTWRSRAGTLTTRLDSNSFTIMEASEENSLTPKEAALIEILDDDVRSQRSIASESGFSLGMTNLLLKRLVSKGYIKIVTLNGRTLKYMLTPRGFSEKLRKSYSYIISSIRQMNGLKDSIQYLAREKGAPDRRILVVGKSELADLVRQSLAEIELESEFMSAEKLKELGSEYKGAFLFQCDAEIELPDTIAENELEVVETATLLL